MTSFHRWDRGIVDQLPGLAIAFGGHWSFQDAPDPAAGRSPGSAADRRQKWALWSVGSLPRVERERMVGDHQALIEGYLLTGADRERGMAVALLGTAYGLPDETKHLAGVTWRTSAFMDGLLCSLVEDRARGLAGAWAYVPGLSQRWHDDLVSQGIRSLERWMVARPATGLTGRVRLVRQPHLVDAACQLLEELGNLVPV